MVVTTTKFPELVIKLGDSDMKPNVNTSETCKSGQKNFKIVYNHIISTTPMFRNQTKQTVAGLNPIRDGYAPSQFLPSEEQKIKRHCGENFELEAEAGYIRTVNFENEFCTE